MNIPRLCRPWPLWTALALALAGYVFLWICVKPAIFGSTHADFACFYRAGRMVLAGDGARVYDLRAQQQYDLRLGTRSIDPQGHAFSLPYVFAPFSLALFAPLATLPYRQAEMLWYAANAVVLLTLPVLLHGGFGSFTRLPPLAVIAPVFFVPAVLALLQGQTSILLLLIFAAAFCDLRRSREVRAGCILALAAIKPQLALPALLALVVWRKWTTLVAFASSCVALLGLSTAMVGWRATLLYPRALLEFSTLPPGFGGEHPESMPNLRGALYLLLHARVPDAVVERLTILLSVVLLLAMTLVLARQGKISASGFSLLLVTTLLVSYHAYLHDDTLLLLPALLAGSFLRGTMRSGIRAGVAAAVFLLYLVPLTPTSLSTTALQMFEVTLALAVLLAMASSKHESDASVPLVRAATSIEPHPQKLPLARLTR